MTGQKPIYDLAQINWAGSPLKNIMIPMMTYACEGWTTNKEENKRRQRTFNETIKTLLCVPKGTPTTIVLNDTGNIPTEYTIKEKKTLQAKCIDQMKKQSLIKDATHHYAGRPRRPPPPQLQLRRSRDLAHASIPLAQTPWGLTGRAWLQAGAQQAVIVVDPSLNSLGIDSRNVLKQAPGGNVYIDLTKELHVYE